MARPSKALLASTAPAPKLVNEPEGETFRLRIIAKGQDIRDHLISAEQGKDESMEMFATAAVNGEYDPEKEFMSYYLDWAYGSGHGMTTPERSKASEASRFKGVALAAIKTKGKFLDTVKTIRADQKKAHAAGKKIGTDIRQLDQAISVAATAQKETATPLTPAQIAAAINVTKDAELTGADLLAAIKTLTGALVKMTGKDDKAPEIVVPAEHMDTIRDMLNDARKLRDKLVAEGTIVLPPAKK